MQNNILQIIVQNKKISDKSLMTIFDNYGLHSEIFAQKHLSQEFLDQIVNDRTSNESILYEVADHENTCAKTLSQIIYHPNVTNNVLEAVALHKNTTPDILDAIVKMLT